MLDFSLSDEQKALVDTARRFARERIIPVAAECDREARFPRDVFEAAHAIGLVNMTVPTEYGGAGLGELDNAMVAEQLAYGCTGIQTSMLANTLALTPIILAGNEAQKKKYLGMLTAGTAVPIVPCHLEGAFEAFPAGVRLPRPHRVRLRIGRPLVFDAVPNTRVGWERVVSEAEAAVRLLADPPEAP